MLILVILAVIAIAVAGVFTVIRKSQVFLDAMQRAQNDPRVVAALGEPVRPSWLVTGSVKTENDNGSADLSVGIEGSKQKGRLSIVATKVDGRWNYSTLRVTPDKGDPIDLLQPPNAPAPDAAAPDAQAPTETETSTTESGSTDSPDE